MVAICSIAGQNRFDGRVGVQRGAQALDQIIQQSQECAADETNQQVLFRRPVEVDGALSDVCACRHIGDGEPLRSSADQQAAGRSKQARSLGRVEFGKVPNRRVHSLTVAPPAAILEELTKNVIWSEMR